MVGGSHVERTPSRRILGGVFGLVDEEASVTGAVSERPVAVHVGYLPDSDRTIRLSHTDVVE